jgi:translation initiation factor 2D
MFAKPFRVKSNTQLKGSDKKKLKLEIRKKFPEYFSAPATDVATDPIDAVMTPKDDITVSKVYTYSGESFLVYYQLKNPIFFEPEKDRGNLHPTVYTLWKCPNLLPALTTHPLVQEKLANGADLVNKEK